MVVVLVVDNCLFGKTNRIQKMNWKKLVVAVVGIQKRNRKQKVVVLKYKSFTVILFRSNKQAVQIKHA